MKTRKSFIAFIKDKKKQILFSVVLSSVLLIINYIIANLPIPLGGEKALLRKIEFPNKVLGRSDDGFLDTMLFVNVTYDKVINSNPITDERGDVVGRIPIVDRKKLLEFLKYLNEKDDYKYILLDVFFGLEAGRTEWDEELFSTILSMDRIVIPKHIGRHIAFDSLLTKAGVADYCENYFFNGFSKYPFIIDGETSLPLKMYQEIKGQKIKDHGFFYTEGCRLVKRCDVLTMDVLANSAYSKGGKKIWYNLGMDLLADTIVFKKPNCTDDIVLSGKNSLYSEPELTRDKYIVIGSFNGDDNHATYKGTVSGAVINYNAFRTLMKGGHIIHPCFVGALFLLYFLLSLYCLNIDSIKNKKTKSTHKWIRVICSVMIWFSSWFGLAMVLTLFCALNYLLFGRTHEVLFTACVFSLLSKCQIKKLKT